VINTNLPHILHRFRDIVFDKSKIAIFWLLLLRFSPDGGVPWNDIRKIFRGGHWMAKVPKDIETLPKILTD